MIFSMVQGQEYTLLLHKDNVLFPHLKKKARHFRKRAIDRAHALDNVKTSDTVMHFYADANLMGLMKAISTTSVPDGFMDPVSATEPRGSMPIKKGTGNRRCKRRLDCEKLGYRDFDMKLTMCIPKGAACIMTKVETEQWTFYDMFEMRIVDFWGCPCE